MSCAEILCNKPFLRHLIKSDVSFMQAGAILDQYEPKLNSTDNFWCRLPCIKFHLIQTVILRMKPMDGYIHRHDLTILLSTSDFYAKKHKNKAR
jgi:hypothetical protein